MKSTHRLNRKSIFYPKADVNCSFSSIDKYRLIKKKRANTCLGDVQKIIKYFFEIKEDGLTYINGGTFHNLYDVKFTDKSYIIKVSFDPLFSTSLRIEHRITSIIQKYNIPCAHSLFVDASKAIVNFEYQIIEKAKGVVLTKTCDQDYFFIIVKELGHILSQIHKIDMEGFGLLNKAGQRGLHTSWPSYIFRNLEDHINFCYTQGDIGDKEKEKICDYFSCFRSIFDQSVSKLLHGDLGNHNIFVKGKKITAIIDWEDCLAGDPIYDIALWATFHSDENYEHFLNGYFKDKAKLSKNFYKKFWAYYLRISLAKTVHRHKFGYQDDPNMPKASTRIQKALKNLEKIL